MSALLVSCVTSARAVKTQDFDAREIIESIRTGKPLKLGPLTLASTIEGIRKTFADTLAQTRDRKAAKNAVNEAKKQLPAIMFSGRFSQRKGSCLLQHSGLLCADLDELGEQLPEVWNKIKSSPHLWAMFRSPTGDGLKCVFCVEADAAKHKQSFRAVEEHVRARTGVQIDEACSDVARLCFFSYDPDAFLNESAIELPPLEKATSATATAVSSHEIKTRRDIAEKVLGHIDWQTETQGNCKCPGEHLHTTPTQESHCQVLVDGAPTIRCFHGHCKPMLKGVNHELRSRIGKAEHAARQQTQNAANNQPTIVPAYYDAGRRCYWTQNSRGGWIEINEQSLRRLLKKNGFNAIPAQGQRLSQVDQKLTEIQTEQDVAYAGPLAGHQSGVLECYGNRILVTTSPTLLDPKAGHWSKLDQFLRNLLVDGSYDQRPYVYAWLKLAHEALRAGQRRAGPVMAIAGPRNSGKSLLQNLFTVILGGRVAKPYRYMSGHTDFNGELFGAEHLMIEDEAPSTDLRSRRALGAHIKAFTVNETQSCHVKNRQALTLSPFWRVSISLNDEPENLMILPPISDSEHDSLGDKIILLRAKLAPMPMPTQTLEEWAAFWQTVTSELPAFVDYLEKWEIPADIQHPRYGMKTWHHPELLLALDALAPETRLLSLIDEILFTTRENESDFVKLNSKPQDSWTGTAEELEGLLRQHYTYGSEAQKLFNWQAACGTYLGRLAKRYPGRVEPDRTSNARGWIVHAPEAQFDRAA